MLESRAVDLRNIPIGMWSNHPLIGLPNDAVFDISIPSDALRQPGHMGQHRSPPRQSPGSLTLTRATEYSPCRGDL